MRVYKTFFGSIEQNMISLCLLTAQNEKLTAQNAKVTVENSHRTWVMYMVWRFLLADTSTKWFEETFKQSIIEAYGKCPTDLNQFTLKEFVDTSNPKSDEDWFEMMRTWSALLQKKFGFTEHDEKFSELTQALINKHAENTEARKAREAQARQHDTVRARINNYFDRKWKSDGAFGFIKKATQHTT